MGSSLLGNNKIKMITVKSLSDTHGNLPVITEGFDLMLIAGDITPAEWGYGSKMVQWDWLINEFKDWVDSLPYNNIWSKVYIVPGNHDKVFEAISDAERKELEYILGPHCELLIHEEKIFSALNEDGSQTDYRIFGTPFCKIFGNWSFMVYDSVLESKFNEIPDMCCRLQHLRLDFSTENQSDLSSNDLQGCRCGLWRHPCCLSE